MQGKKKERLINESDADNCKFPKWEIQILCSSDQIAY